MAKAKQKAGDFPEEFLDQLIGSRKTPEEFFGGDGLFKQIQKKPLFEAAHG
jgi:hypothetical protein